MQLSKFWLRIKKELIFKLQQESYLFVFVVAEPIPLELIPFKFIQDNLGHWSFMKPVCKACLAGHSVKAASYILTMKTPFEVCSTMWDSGHPNYMLSFQMWIASVEMQFHSH